MNIDTSNFFQWILDQPDHRPLDMLAAYSYPEAVNSCGCLMVQFLQTKGCNGTINCSMDAAEIYDKDDRIGETLTFIPFPAGTPDLIMAMSNVNPRPKTFGPAKNFLINNVLGFTDKD